jgi:hypothetical protein
MWCSLVNLGILIKAKFNFLTTKNSLMFDYNPYLAKKKKKVTITEAHASHII